MDERRMKRRAGFLLTAAALMALLSPQMNAIEGLPDALTLSAGDVTSVNVMRPLSAEITQRGGEVIARLERGSDASLSLTAGPESGTAEVMFRWMGMPVKTMTVTVEQPLILVPGGQTLGIAVESEGVVVVGSSDLGNLPSPARKAGIRPGDVIRSIDGVPVSTAGELTRELAAGELVEVEVRRGEDTLFLNAAPTEDPRDGVRKLGVWVRESTAGVGTLTFYDPETGKYGALGHAITDVDTGVNFPVGEGAVYENEIVRITRGKKGVPGELTGAFFEQENALGEIEKNTSAGIFGTAGEALTDGGLYPNGLPVADSHEIHPGSAQILTTIAGRTIRAYACEIERVQTKSTEETRSMVLHITDPELLRETGGIVQGMSGSPIIQDGKLVGAVTHVLVNDPTRGYGIFIENMLDAAS